jgi:hypothetical protein
VKNSIVEAYYVPRINDIKPDAIGLPSTNRLTLMIILFMTSGISNSSSIKSNIFCSLRIFTAKEIAGFMRPAGIFISYPIEYSAEFTLIIHFSCYTPIDEIEYGRDEKEDTPKKKIRCAYLVPLR